MSVHASKPELIHLIYQHLKENGFHTAADELHRLSPQVTHTLHTLTVAYRGTDRKLV